MTKSAIIAGCFLLAAVTIHGATNRYSAGPLTERLMWRLDKWSGRLSICNGDLCASPTDRP